MSELLPLARPIQLPSASDLCSRFGRRDKDIAHSDHFLGEATVSSTVFFPLQCPGGSGSRRVGINSGHEAPPELGVLGEEEGRRAWASPLRDAFRSPALPPAGFVHGKLLITQASGCP